jgi:sugar phosphate isomerase/epimerase
MVDIAHNAVAVHLGGDVAGFFRYNTATMNQPIAIQSWCYRHFKALPDFFTQLKAAGVTATELCGVHASFTDAATFPATVKAFGDAGVQIVCIGVEHMHGDDAKDRPKFEFCKAAGVKHMSISFAPEAMDDNFAALKRVEKLAEQYDLKLSIHNHGGYDWLGNERILKYVFSKIGPRIGLHMDTAWTLDAKQDPHKWVETFADRLYGVHVKDFVFDRARNPTDVVIGTGNLDLPRFMKLLQQINFTGPLVIEYEGDEKNPVPALKDCVQRLTALR